LEFHHLEYVGCVLELLVQEIPYLGYMESLIYDNPVMKMS
jgi:hypothetical protein